VGTREFEEIYSSKTNSELLALSADTNSLREEARQALSSELLRRKLTALDSPFRPDADARFIIRRVRWIGLWLLNTLIATVGVAINVGLISYSTRPFVSRALRAELIQTPYYPFPILIGLLVGYFSFLRFRGSYRYWVWILPAFLTFHSLCQWQSENGATWSIAFAHFFAYVPYPQNRDQLDSTVLLYMAGAYSLGALVQHLSNRSRGQWSPR